MAEARRRRRRRRGGGAFVVVRLLLLLAHRLLHPAPPARRDGHRRRCRQLAVAVHRDLRRHARRRAGLWAHRGALPEARIRPPGLLVLHRQHRDLLRAVHPRRRHGNRLRRPRLLRVGQPVQPVRGVGVLEFHGRYLPHRTGAAPVRLHRGGGLGRGIARAVALGSARRAPRAHQPSFGLRPFPGGGGVLHPPAAGRDPAWGEA